MGCSLLFHHGDGIVLVHACWPSHLFCLAGDIGCSDCACGPLPGLAWWGYSAPVLLINTASYRLNKTGQVRCTGSGIRILQPFSVLRPNGTLNWPKQSTLAKRQLVDA